MKPGGDGPRIGEMGGAVSNQSEHEAGRVELPQSRVQQRERRDGADVDRHANYDDAARTKAIDPAAEEGREDSEGDGGDGEAGREGLAAPAEFGCERLHKNGEGVDEERSESGHHAETGRQDDAPAVVAEIEFSRAGGLARGLRYRYIYFDTSGKGCI